MKPENHVTNLKCFPQVAAVIGHAKAQHELFLVVININENNSWFDDADDVRDCFSWYNSPQDYDFWSDVSDGINPYKANA